MGRIYSATFEQVLVSAVQDLFEIVAPSDAIVLLHALYLSQASEAGDAESEQLPILIHRGSTSGSGGSTITPRPMQVGDAAFGGTVEANNTTQATEGDILHAESFNVMAGLALVWTPEIRPQASPSGRIIVELQAAPADAITMDGSIYFEEIGG